MHKYETALIGARGYAGLELARILLRHPAARLAACFTTDSNFALADYLPEKAARNVATRKLSELEAVAKNVSTCFLATPAEVSIELAPKLLAQGCKVIDLSGAFRLKGETEAQTKKLYSEWYAFNHAAPELVAQAEYGLVPFCGPASRSKLIANPGCYATAALLAIIPLLKTKIIDPSRLVLDAKSGTSGAGRKAAENLLFSEVDGECLPYKVGAHQHFPEICNYVDQFAEQTIDPHFTTHLLPIRRGIVVGAYAYLSQAADAASVTKAFEKAYGNYPLIRLTQDMSLKRVVGSARAHIAHKVVGDKVYVFSLIDNLLKGSASQAVENFNRLHDLPVETSLLDIEGVL